MDLTGLGLDHRPAAFAGPAVAGGAFAGLARLASLVGWALRTTDIASPRPFAQSLDASSPPKELLRLAGEDTGALEAFGKRGLALEVTGRERSLPAALR